MTNTYRVLLPVLVNGEHKQGDVFEHQFDSPEDEQANLDSGLLEIVPRTYKVLGPSDVFETPPDGTFEKALLMGQEAPLIDGGFIKRVEIKKPAEAKKASKGGKSEK